MILGKLDSEELRYFNLAAVSYMIGSGHHALHEFKTVWSALKIPYVDGDYMSIIPKDLIKSHFDFFELQEEFQDILCSHKIKMKV